MLHLFFQFRLYAVFVACGSLFVVSACDDASVDGRNDARASLNTWPNIVDAGILSSADAGNPAEMDAGNVVETDAGNVVETDAGNVVETDAGNVVETDAGIASALEAVRFIAFGDQGEGNAAQYAVSDVMESVCASQGCDFILLLGDNFYDVGVEGNEDPQWQDKFELPYANIENIQFYPVLGNHDGGASGSGASISTGNNEIEYTPISNKWNMPSRYYRHSKGNVDVYALDTSSIFFSYISLGGYRDLRDAQANWLASEYAVRPQNNWRIAIGHHPYLSNGKHYNAGSYEGYDIPFIGDIWDGTDIKEFMDENVCGKVDLYLCGHDHNRQWHETRCNNTILMVSGAGAKNTDFQHEQPTYFQDDQKAGFVWIEIIGDEMTVEWWDEEGVMNFTGTETRPRLLP